MIIDVHAHLNDEKLNEIREEIILNLQNNNVEKVINAGCDLKTCNEVIDLANRYENL